MSETVQEASEYAKVIAEAHGLPVSDKVFRRDVDLELVPGDGRTLEGRMVPYNQVATVSDGGPAYRESFSDGAFDAQVKAANRVDVLLNFEHQQSIGDVVGRGVQLRSVPGDGFYGTFRVLDHADGDKALELVNTGVLTGMSIEFVDIKSKVADGVVVRESARIRNVALCRTPAYQDAKVLAVREAPLEVVELPDVRPPNWHRLEGLGILPAFHRAVVNRPWNGDPARYTDEQYQAACLIDRGGDDPVKERCSLPVLEPNGDLNVNALGPAAAALRGARGGLSDVTSEQKAAAARKLARFYRMADMAPPPGVVMMAG